MYELFIEGQRVDIDQKISVQLTFAIDDIANFASRETSFSKQLVLPGTANNNAVFGHIHEMGSNNIDSPGQPNIGSIFNVAQTSRAELRLNGLLVLRGIFRMTGIIKEGNEIEYEGALFGELSGLMSEISNKKLEDLDFSQYDHVLSHTAISNSWDNTPGSGYFYPLIDYGNYRDPSNASPNNDYNIGTFRPALYVKEYLDKMFEAAGYTYASDFINSAYFKSLIIPHNTKRLEKIDSVLLNADYSGNDIYTATNNVEFDTAIGGNFTSSLNNSVFTYNQPTPVTATVKLFIEGFATIDNLGTAEIIVYYNNAYIYTQKLFGTVGVAVPFVYDISLIQTFNQNDTISVRLFVNTLYSDQIELFAARFDIETDPPIVVGVSAGDTVDINYTIPRGIFQKDFLASLIKMFNLYIYEDRLDEKKLNIVPYRDFLSSTTLDWTYKVARDKAWKITPMGNLNARIFEYKYKDDNDFYNESYKKKYNQNYADRQFDSGFQFSQDRISTDIIFASSPLIKYDGADKHVVAIYKKSNELSAEDRMDSNIRILFSKKKSANTWYILGLETPISKTSYGYAGHLDDPNSPTQDLNFGAPKEVYFTASTYPFANLFNEYWDEYIAQIIDKDSKILECYVYLKPLDIAQLDFSKPVFIDGIRFRINKISDYDYTNDELVKVELLKIIE